MVLILYERSIRPPGEQERGGTQTTCQEFRATSREITPRGATDEASRWTREQFLLLRIDAARMAPRARADARRGCPRRPGQCPSEDPCADVSTTTSRSADSTSPPSTPAWRSGLKAWLMTVLCILVAVGRWRAKARTWARRRDRIVASPAPRGASQQLQRRVAAKAGKLWQQLQHMLVLLATSAGGCTLEPASGPAPMP